MRKWLIQTIAVSMLVGSIGAVVGMKAVQAQSKTYTGERMQLIGQQSLTGNVRFKFFHDQETGQEVICTDTVDADSCYLTGRKW